MAEVDEGNVQDQLESDTTICLDSTVDTSIEEIPAVKKSPQDKSIKEISVGRKSHQDASTEETSVTNQSTEENTDGVKNSNGKTPEAHDSEDTFVIDRSGEDETTSHQKEHQGIYPADDTLDINPSADDTLDINPFADDTLDVDTSESSSGKDSGSQNETSQEKEDRGIFPANPYADDTIILDSSGSSSWKESSSQSDKGSSQETKRVKRSLKRKTHIEEDDEVIFMRTVALDIEGDEQQESNEEINVPYPVHEIPSFDSNVSGVLADVEYSMDTGKKIQEPKPKKSCFNCLGDHNVPDCPEPHDQQKIAANRKKLLNNRIQNVRYHEDADNKYGQFQPGKISENLREALGLRSKDLPHYIYRMRYMGYPPGWLKEAEVHQADMKMYDGTGQSVSHPDSEEGETEQPLVKYNPDKLVSFPGFNVPVPRGYYDSWRDLNFPPMQDTHRKSEFKKFMELNKAGAYKKRKLKDESLRSNGSFTQGSSEMEIEDGTLNSSVEIEFNPPLPDTPMPPLPQEEPPRSTPPSNAEEGELVEDDSESSMGFLEAKRQALLEQLDNSGNISSDSVLENAPDKKDENASDKKETTSIFLDTEGETAALENEPTKKEKSTPPDTEGDSQSSAPVIEDSENSCSDGSASTQQKGVKKQRSKHHRSESKGFLLGVAIPPSITPFDVLPDAEKWTVDVADHINFDNLPDALGTWEKMKGLVRTVRSKMSQIHAEDDN